MERTSFRRVQVSWSILGHPENAGAPQVRILPSSVNAFCQASVAVHAQVSYTWIEWFNSIAWYQNQAELINP